MAVLVHRYVPRALGTGRQEQNMLLVSEVRKGSVRAFNNRNKLWSALQAVNPERFCSARRCVTAGAASLASYPVLPTHETWLSSSIQHLLKNLGTGGARLQLIFLKPSLHFDVLPAGTSVQAETWQVVQRMQPDAVLLMRPIRSPTDYCPVGSEFPAGADDVCSSPAQSESEEATPTDSLDGVLYSNEGHFSQDAVVENAGNVQYYGVVIQHLRGENETDGCYVLKTTSNRDSFGCNCMHYTLTHVCTGRPLAWQLVQSWLCKPQQ